MLRRLLIVIAVLLLTVWVASYLGVRLYRLDTELSYQVMTAAEQTPGWYPPIPYQWNRVGVLIGSAPHDPLAAAVVEQLARGLEDIFTEVVSLGQNSAFTGHNDRLDAVLVFTTWKPEVEGPFWNRKFSFNLELKSLEPVNYSLKDEQHYFCWKGKISGTTRGLLFTRLFRYRLAEQVSNAIYEEIAKFMSSRTGEDATTAAVSLNQPIRPIQWFEPIRAQPVINKKHPLVPEGFSLLCHFIQTDLYGTTEFLTLWSDLNSQEARVRLRESWRNQLGSTIPDFVTTDSQKWVLEFDLPDSRYAVVLFQDQLTHLTVKKVGRLITLHRNRLQVFGGQKSLESLIAEAQDVFMTSPLTDTRLFLANCQLEELLTNWEQIEAEKVLQEIDSVERMFLSCHHPYDDAFDDYVLARFYYKLGVNCDTSYLLSAEHALNRALESRSSQIYPYALLAKALVLSVPDYEGRDYQEARRILNGLIQNPALGKEARLQLQRVRLLSPQDSDPGTDFDNMLASYVAMLQGDWALIEKLLLKDPVQSPVERACRALLYLNLCQQTGRDSAEIKALAELHPQHLLLLDHFMRERYCGIYR